MGTWPEPKFLNLYGPQKTINYRIDSCENQFRHGIDSWERERNDGRGKTYSFPGIVFSPITRLKISAQELSDLFWDGVAVWRRHWGVAYSNCKENPIYVFLFWELLGLSPNFHIHVSVNVFIQYIPRIGPQFSYSRIGRSKVEIYNTLTYTWMWKSALRPRNSFSGNICFEFSVLVLCSVLVPAFLVWFPSVLYLHEAPWRKF